MPQPPDERAYFESYYKATVQDRPTDLTTIGRVTELEARFHYNSVENAILHALARLTPPPPAAMVGGWREMQKRRRLRHFDIGVGTGHWIDFMREVCYVAESVGAEINADMRGFLGDKYAGTPVTILDVDLADAGFSPSILAGPVDYVTAIGVMFHVIDDTRWRRAISHMAAALKPGGIAFVGGEFGDVTADRVVVRTDAFRTWHEHDQTADAHRVVKRVRSLAEWHDATRSAGLRLVEVVASDKDSALRTPENNVAVLTRDD